MTDLTVPGSPDAPQPRRGWCLMLAKLVSPSFPLEASSALLDMLPMLDDYGDEYFTTATLKHVATHKRRQSVPAYDEITAAFLECRRLYLVANRPALPPPNKALPPPSKALPPPDEAQLEALRTQTQAEVEYVANLLRPWRAHPEGHAAPAQPRPAPPPLPDVSFKGELLQRSREARGIKPVVRADVVELRRNTRERKQP